MSLPAEAAGLLADFQNRYGQAFDWWPLENRVDAFRALIAKRTAQPRTISDFLGTDHHRLTECWEQFLEAVKTCELSYETLFIMARGRRFAAADGLSQFIYGLRRHIRMEEDRLFPMFENRSREPAGAGPTPVMRAEHQEIETNLRMMEKLVSAGDCATVILTIEGQPVHPSLLFRSHDTKEEKVLYPMADQLFTQEEKDDLCLKMQTV